MKFSIELNHFVELLKNSNSLDHVFLLKLIEEKFELTELLEENLKFRNLHQGLFRKGYITAEDNLTTLGKELLIFIASKNSDKKYVKKKPVNEDFITWWTTYPGTNTFTHKGQMFKGDRSLRVGKDDCRTKFNKILLEGEYTAQQLIDALAFDVLQKKEISVKDKENKLKYMQNSLTYLNQRSYEPFIELLKDNPKLAEDNSSSGGSTDI